MAAPLLTIHLRIKWTQTHSKWSTDVSVLDFQSYPVNLWKYSWAVIHYVDHKRILWIPFRISIQCGSPKKSKKQKLSSHNNNNNGKYERQKAKQARKFDANKCLGKQNNSKYESPIFHNWDISIQTPTLTWKEFVISA